MVRSFLMLLAALVQVLLLPRSPTAATSLARRSPTQLKGGNEASNVLWGAKCSPRLALLRRYQDATLQCEVFAPTGTILTWYKDHKPIDRQVEVVEEMTNNIWRRSSNLRASTSSKVHLSSIIYIDCASLKDQGNYHLEVRTPDNQVYTRHFTVNLTEDKESVRGGTCLVDQDLLAYIPRISQYARQAVAQHGHDVLLPCRLHGRAPAITTTWTFRNTRLVPMNDRYQVLPSGDLLVRGLQPEDHGIFTCRAISQLEPSIQDQVHTFLYPLDQKEASE